MRTPIHTSGLGDGEIESGYPNTEADLRFPNNRDIIIDLSFDAAIGNWKFKRAWIANPNYVPNLKSATNSYRIDYKPTDAELQACIQTANDTPQIMEKVRKCLKDALKRLNVSVPRLKDEYERAYKSKAEIEKYLGV